MPTLQTNIHPNVRRPAPVDMRPSAIAARAQANGLKSLSEVELNELMSAVGQATQAPLPTVHQPQVNASPEVSEAMSLAINLSKGCKDGLVVGDYLRLGLLRMREIEAERKALAMNEWTGYDAADPMKPTHREAALNTIEKAKRPASWYDLNDPLGENDKADTTVRSNAKTGGDEFANYDPNHPDKA